MNVKRIKAFFCPVPVALILLKINSHYNAIILCGSIFLHKILWQLVHVCRNDAR